jgi:anti-sigma factor RsiW
MPDDLHELSALYALDALTGDDLARFERHLEDCDDCRGELASLRAAGASLAYAADGPPPPEDLRERILRAARAEGQNVVPLQARRLTPARAVAALAAVAAVAALVFGLQVSRDDSTSTSSILRDPAARHIAVPGRGQLVGAPTGAAVLDLTLPAPPDGKTYEAWVSLPHVRRAGEFAGRRFKLDERVQHGAQVMVTIERDGGTDAPTSKPIVVVQA